MSLVACPACTHAISINAVSCPSCGEPRSPDLSVKEVNKKDKLLKRKYHLIWIIGWLVLFFPVAIIMIIINMNGGRMVSVGNAKRIDDASTKHLSGKGVLAGLAFAFFLVYIFAKYDL